MNGQRLVLAHQPDVAARELKARWRRLRQLVEETASWVEESMSTRPVRVLVVGAVEEYAGLLSTTRDRVVCFRTADHPAPGDASAFHAVVVLLPTSVTTGERRDILRSAFDKLMPARRMAVFATVVAPLGSRVANAIPPLSALLNDVQAVSGGRVHLSDITSIRWGSESLVRGVRLSYDSVARSLTVDPPTGS